MKLHGTRIEDPYARFDQLRRVRSWVSPDRIPWYPSELSKLAAALDLLHLRCEPGMPGSIMDLSISHARASGAPDGVRAKWREEERWMLAKVAILAAEIEVKAREIPLRQGGCGCGIGHKRGAKYCDQCGAPLTGDAA